MFDTCYLHIGPPKTGTTSLQRTLLKNAAVLERSSVIFPTQAPNHKFVVSAFMQNPAAFDFNKLRKLNAEAIEREREEALA